jgi:hypothetical protein
MNLISTYLAGPQELKDDLIPLLSREAAAFIDDWQAETVEQVACMRIAAGSQELFETFLRSGRISESYYGRVRSGDIAVDAALAADRDVPYSVTFDYMGYFRRSGRAPAVPVGQMSYAVVAAAGDIPVVEEVAAKYAAARVSSEMNLCRAARLGFADMLARAYAYFHINICDFVRCLPGEVDLARLTCDCAGCRRIPNRPPPKSGRTSLEQFSVE